MTNERWSLCLNKRDILSNIIQSKHVFFLFTTVYQNQSEEYVIVSSSECAESLCHSKSPSLQPQQTPQQQENVPQDFNGQTQQPKTFFTTLNQPEQQRNINEFINSCENSNEGINFFQDSELSSRQQQEKLNQEQNEMNFQNQQGQGNNYNQGKI